MNRPFLFYSFILLLIFNCIFFYSKAQSSDPSFSPVPFAQPPNSASLEKFTSFPVSYYTGLPEISIPIYTISSGNLKVPIILSYHASGIKVSEVSSWVGAGWTLIAGGEITRKVMGAKSDEFGGFLSGIMRTADQINPSTSDGQSYLQNVIANHNDCEPDIFSYTYPGGNGRFFFNRANNYQPALIPYTPIQISYTNNSSALSFLIIDESGNKYSYGNNHEMSGTNSGGIITDAVSGWMLDQIISADGTDTITFKYATQSGLTYHDVIDTRVVDDEVWCATSNPCPYQADPVAYASTKDVFSSTTEKALQEIDFKNGKIVFKLSGSYREDINTFKSLANIQLFKFDFKTNAYTLIKTFSLYQSYFQKGTDVLTKRLRFDSLKIKSSTGANIETYSFDYNTLTPPTLNSKQKDFWGFYNGKNNDNLIPRQQIDYAPTSQNPGSYPIWIGSSIDNGRDPDTVLNQACILKTIHYPTGGHTDFYFETNRYVDVFHNTHLSGGLRIKKIIDYDAVTSTVNKRTFQYDVSRPNYDTGMRYYYLSSLQNHDYWVPLSGGSQKIASKRTRTYISEPSISLIPSDGSIVVYPVVTEYNGDEQNNIGKTVYMFTDYRDVLQTASSVKPVITDYSYRRGQLTGKFVYKKNSDGTYQPISKEINTYSVFPQTIYDAIGLTARQQLVQDGPGPYQLYQMQMDWLFNNYSATSDDNYLDTKTEISYDPEDSTKYLQTITNLDYGNINHQQPTKITVDNSKGETTITNNKYPLDYTISGSPTDNTAKGIKVLQDKHVISVPVEQYTQISNSDGSNVKTVSSVFNVYKTSKPYLSSMFKLESNSSLTDFLPATITASSFAKDSRYKQKMILDTYDSYGNILQQHKANDANHSYIWDYNHDYPIAEAVNAPQTQIAYTSFEADGTGNWTVGSTARNTTTPVTGSKSYNLTNGNVVSPSLPAGSYKVTVWAKSAPTVSGTNTKHITGRKFNNFTYHEFWVTLSATATITVSGSTLIDELRLYPANAQMTTYTYTPLIGMTSRCDINNDITYYEYDGLGRLAFIRDQDNNIMKKYGYNYAGQQFKPNQFVSSLQTKTFVKNDCSDTENFSGSEVEDTVEEGMFESDSSQAEADSLARAYLDSAGQANANYTGTCLPLLQLLLANYDRIAGFTIKLTSVVDTARTYTIAFPEDSDSAMSLQRIPQGRYDIEVSKPDNTESYVFTVSGPNGDIQINARNASWANVPVTTATFTKIAIGIRQQ